MKRNRWISILLIAALLVPAALGGCNQNPGNGDLNIQPLYTVTVGEALQLDNPSDSIHWSSSDDSIAVVSDSGLVTAVNAGTVTITAAWDGALYTAQVQVSPAAEAAVYNGLTAADLDAIPCVGYRAFRQAMDAGWNFGWEGSGTLEYNAAKADFDGTAAADSTIWRLGTLGEEGTCATVNAGWGVQLWTKGEGNIAYMYNKLRIPPSTTEFRVWAVGNTSNEWSGAGSIRAVAIYRENGGDYVTRILKPLASSFTGSKRTRLQDNGSVKFTDAAWNMPDTVDGCMLTYDISDLPTGQDVVILIEGIGLGETLGDEYSEAAEGTPAGEMMPDVVIVKRVMFVASTVPVEEGTPLSVPESNQEQELLFKIVGEEALYLNFLPPTAEVYEKAPVLFLICGGGWKMQSRASILSMMDTMVSGLRAEGFAVVCPDYRVITDTNGLTVQEQIADLMDAARYIAHYAGALGIDPQKIVTSGHSAGAHLALMVGLAPQELFPGDGFSDTFRVTCCSGVGAIAFLYRDNPTDDQGKWSYTCVSDGIYDDEMAHRCSPYTYISADSVPTLMIHGNLDDVVSIQNAILSCEKAREVGADFELLTSVNGNHVLVSPVRGKVASPNLDEALRMAVDWICGKVNAV